jgi:hypothetical protein
VDAAKPNEYVQAAHEKKKLKDREFRAKKRHEAKEKEKKGQRQQQKKKKKG